jgi:hypothetical protein
MHALAAKTTERGCTPGEQAAAAQKLGELMMAYSVAPEELQGS